MTSDRDLFKYAALLLCITACSIGGDAALSDRCDRGDGGITLPPGFCASVFADEVGVARHLVVTPTGDVYVALEDANRSSANSTRVRGANGRGGMVALRDTNADGRADIRLHVGDGSRSGMALQSPWLYSSSVTSVLRYRLEPGSLAPVGAPDTVVTGFPDTGGHSSRSLALDDSGNLFVNIGSDTNACRPVGSAGGLQGLDPAPSSTCELAFGASIPNAFTRPMTFRSVTRPAFGTPLDSPGAQASTLSTPPSTAATVCISAGPSCTRKRRAMILRPKN